MYVNGSPIFDLFATAFCVLVKVACWMVTVDDLVLSSAGLLVRAVALPFEPDQEL